MAIDYNDYMMKLLLNEMVRGGQTPEQKESAQLRLEAQRRASTPQALEQDKQTYYRNRTSDMESIINSAQTKEGLESALVAFNQFDKDNDKWGGQWDEAGDIFGSKLNTKRTLYSKMENAYAQAQQYYETGPIGKEKIMKYDIDDFPDLSKEVAKVGEILNIINSSKSQFPNYTMKSDKQSTEMLKIDMQGRLGTLESSLRAIAKTGNIPMEVIELTMMGDPTAVNNEITTNKNMVKQQIDNNRRLLNYSKKISARSPDASIFPAMETGTDEGAAFAAIYKQAVGQDKGSYDPKIINSWIEKFTEKDITLKQEFLRWSRTGYKGDIDLDKLIGDYSPSKDTISSDTTKMNKNVNLYGSKDEMKKDIIGRTGSENIDIILKDTTGKNLSELKKDISDKDKSFFKRFFDDPVLKVQLEKNRKVFEEHLSNDEKIKFHRKKRSAENYLAESLWKYMGKDDKTKYKKLSNFKDSFNKEMKIQYDNHVKATNYPGTYLAWLKGKIEEMGLYMPIGLGGAWNQ